MARTLSVLVLGVGCLLACTKDHPRISREPREAKVERTRLDETMRERSRSCEVCTYFGNCSIEQLDRNLPCCEPIRFVRESGEEDAELTAACQEAWVHRRKAMQECVACLDVENGRPCLNIMGSSQKAHFHPCCEERLPEDLRQCESH